MQKNNVEDKQGTQDSNMRGKTQARPCKINDDATTHRQVVDINKQDLNVRSRTHARASKFKQNTSQKGK